MKCNAFQFVDKGNIKIPTVIVNLVIKVVIYVMDQLQLNAKNVMKIISLMSNKLLV